LEEPRKLRSKVIHLRLGVRVEGTRVLLGVENRSPEGPSSCLEGQVVSLEGRPIVLRAMAVGMRELERVDGSGE